VRAELLFGLIGGMPLMNLWWWIRGFGTFKLANGSVLTMRTNANTGVDETEHSYDSMAPIGNR